MSIISQCKNWKYTNMNVHDTCRMHSLLLLHLAQIYKIKCTVHTCMIQLLDLISSITRQCKYDKCISPKIPNNGTICCYERLYVCRKLDCSVAQRPHYVSPFHPFSSDPIFIIHYATPYTEMHTKFQINPSMFPECRPNTNLLHFHASWNVKKF
jgi:hypothetical protein